MQVNTSRFELFHLFIEVTAVQPIKTGLRATCHRKGIHLTNLAWFLLRSIIVYRTIGKVI